MYKNYDYMYIIYMLSQNHNHTVRQSLSIIHKMATPRHNEKLSPLLSLESLIKFDYILKEIVSEYKARHQI